MRVVISYDIAGDRARRKVADLMESVLRRVQYSVFEGDVPETQLKDAVDKALGYIDPEVDSLRVYHICEACAARIDSYGRPVYVSSGNVEVI
jgi:CRISPR-associated protein Cas2